MSIVDLVSGKLKGSVKVGESVDSNNKAYESSIIFGGLGNPTPQGNTMLTGTVNPAAYYLSLSDKRVINTLSLAKAWKNSLTSPMLKSLIIASLKATL